MRALIVDSGLGRGSLAAVRGLARGGWTVGLAGPTRRGLPMLSRHVSHRHIVPAHGGGAEGFVAGLERAIAAGGYEVVFGCSDGEILTLSRERERLGARVPHPPHEVMLRAIDKSSLAAVARDVGLSTPPEASCGAEAREQWGAVAMIVKERLHGTLTGGGAFTHIAPEGFEDPAGVDRRVQEILDAGGLPVVQPLLEGRLTAFSSVVDDQGRMLARVQQIAERTYPRGAGLSARARTLPIDEQLGESVGALLRKLGWFGLSELQFIQPPDGEPVLIDFNGRFYGSLSLALAAGANLPDVWARSATGRSTDGAGDARPGVRYQWLEGDLQAARERSHGLLRDLGGSLCYARRAHGSIWSATDPLPGLLTAGSLLGQTVRMLARARGGAGQSGEDGAR